MGKFDSRRGFLKAAPMAAVAGMSLADAPMFAIEAAPEPYRVFAAETLAEDERALKAKPGNNNLFESKTLPFAVVMTTEEKKAAKEFEWHEGRDHILQVIDGTTVYELGGTPQNGRKTRPGEWLAPESAGSKTVTLRKGDMLVIPRGTPHKRSTAESVTFYLISPSGVV